mmetsp:Transcript_14277/g.41965  ORF Transcript_14277/g.41965 Transcript_14277/m.41965 type:complete len:165 (-) Transcript_14277:122-616(-)
MASVDVLHAGADDVHQSAYLSQLLRDLHISSCEPHRPRTPVSHALTSSPAPQLAGGAAHAKPPQALFAPRSAAPSAQVESVLCNELQAAWPCAQPVAQAAPQHAPTLSDALPVARPRSPDSRYVTTNWSSQDEVEEELSFMMADSVAIHDEGPYAPRHDLSYIS